MSIFKRFRIEVEVNPHMKKVYILLLFFLVSGFPFLFGQNSEKLYIEEGLENQRPIIMSNCKPDYIRIEISSQLPDLQFHSNMVPDSLLIVEPKPEENKYLICHPRMNFLLTISGPRYEQAIYELFTIRGLYYLRVKSMKRFTGSLSILDDGDAENAQVYIGNQLIGKLPFINKPLNTGKYIVTIRKEGYMSSEVEYPVEIHANEDFQLRVSMELFKDFYIKTDPPNAEIWVDGKIKGLSNHTISIPALYHTLTITKSGYATEKLNIFVDEKSPNKEVIYRKLKIKYPLTILNEGKKNYQLHIQGTDSLSNLILDRENSQYGQENLLPYGKYRLTLTDGNTVVYRGRHTHSSKYKPVITLPVYSRNSFKTLSLDYAGRNNIEVSLGQSVLFGGCGLSTSILSMQYLYTGVSRSSAVRPAYTDTMAILIPSIFLLNWDLRIGGSIFRFLDISLLGRFKYSPGLKLLGVNITGYNDATGLTYFYGMELTSRLPYINLNLKIGNQVIDGRTYIFDKNTGDYTKEKIPLRINRQIVSFGLVLNGPIEKTNDMVRLWKRPLMGECMRSITRHPVN